MKLQITNFYCKKCNSTYKIGELPQNLYGYFLLRSKKSRKAIYLDAISDPTFQAVKKFVRHLNQPQPDNSRLAQQLFSNIIDRAPDDSKFMFELDPKCPKCNVEFDNWTVPEPPEYTDENVHEVSHSDWDKLSTTEKNDELKFLVAAIKPV